LKRRAEVDRDVRRDSNATTVGFFAVFGGLVLVPLFLTGLATVYCLIPFIVLMVSGGIAFVVVYRRHHSVGRAFLGGLATVGMTVALLITATFILVGTVCATAPIWAPLLR
jgi:hypothetical protein